MYKTRVFHDVLHQRHPCFTRVLVRVCYVTLTRVCYVTLTRVDYVFLTRKKYVNWTRVLNITMCNKRVKHVFTNPLDVYNPCTKHGFFTTFCTNVTRVCYVTLTRVDYVFLTRKKYVNWTRVYYQFLTRVRLEFLRDCDTCFNNGFRHVFD